MARWLAALMLVGLLGAAASEAMAAPYEIDTILSLTGGGAFLGQTQQRSLQLAEKLVNESGGINGQPVQFVVHDDQSSPQVAVQVAAAILARHPAVLLGSGLVATCNAIAPQLHDQTLMYCLSPGIHPAKGGFVETVPIATRDGQQAMVRYFRGRGWTRIAFIGSTDATGKEAEEDLDAVLALPENHDVTLVAREHFNPADVSAIAQMERIRGAAPQVLFAWSTGAAVATLFKAAVQVGLDIPVATTNGNMTYQQMEQYAGFLPRELYLPVSQWPATAQGFSVDPAVDAAQHRFFAAFAAAKLRPDSPAVLPWDPAMILIDSLRALGPQATGPAVRDHIAQLASYAGIQGRYDFQQTPQRGLDVSSALVVRWTPTEQRWTILSKPAGAPLAP